jgi:CheY-like chemotaxis protein
MGTKKHNDIIEKKTIMIVDDEESMRLLIGSYLEMDYNLIFQKDGLEAMLYLKENALPDLILLDMEMPNLNGRVFLRRVKIAGLKLSKIPIIFISSVNIRSLVKSTLKHGAVDYIVKPFDPSELTKKVKLYLG